MGGDAPSLLTSSMVEESSPSNGRLDTQAKLAIFPGRKKSGEHLVCKSYMYKHDIRTLETLETNTSIERVLFSEQGFLINSK